jgi:hypothetical protein
MFEQEERGLFHDAEKEGELVGWIELKAHSRTG